MQKVIISGASSGLGFNLAKKLSKDHYIICFARKHNILKKYFSNNKNVETYKVDLSNLKNLEKFLKKIVKKHPDISVIINNAAQLGSNPINKIKINKLIEIYNVNILSNILIIKYIMPYMKKNKFGRIVNITSGAPLNNDKYFSLYSSTKASLNSFTMTASKEVGTKDIKINLLSPGPINTNMKIQIEKFTGVKTKYFSMNQAVNDTLKLISKKNKINGKFIWRGRILPLRPDLRGINWLKGKASKEYKKI